ncbi:MAG: hypothetical protein ACPG6B_05660 [Oceanihabitans sp.]
MKKSLLIILTIACFSSAIFSQEDYSYLNNITFNTKQDYLKQEPKVLAIVNHLLDEDYKLCSVAEKQDFGTYLIKWAKKNPKYSLTDFGKDYEQLTNNNGNLAILYFVCLIKTAIDNNLVKDNLEVTELHKKTKLLFLNYCSIKRNKIKLTKYMKQERKRIKKENS